MFAAVVGGVTYFSYLILSHLHVIVRIGKVLTEFANDDNKLPIKAIMCK